MKNFKKIATLLLTFVFLASYTVCSFANENMPHEKCEITLTSPNGIKYNVLAVEEPQMQLRSSNGDISKTYSYSLDNKNMQRITPSTRGGQSNDEWDDSISVHGYITITYATTTLSNGNKGYKLTKVSGKWEKSDNYVTMSNRRVSYTCQDVNNQNQITTKLPSGNSFSYTTGYTTYVSDIATGVLGANSHIDLNHAGSGTWELDVTCNYFDNNIIDYL